MDVAPSQATQQGRYLGGRPPYGYQLVGAGLDFRKSSRVSCTEQPFLFDAACFLDSAAMSVYDQSGKRYSAAGSARIRVRLLTITGPCTVLGLRHSPYGSGQWSFEGMP
ncbi:hypothetical protein GCM10027258_48710 [Amycolatopsis stemonae]